MLTPSLATLLEQSRRLTQSQQHQTPLNDLPQIQLGFEQLASQSRRVGGKSTANTGAAGTTAGNA